jgi:hypothetical protein
LCPVHARAAVLAAHRHRVASQAIRAPSGAQIRYRRGRASRFLALFSPNRQPRRTRKRRGFAPRLILRPASDEGGEFPRLAGRIAVNAHPRSRLRGRNSPSDSGRHARFGQAWATGCARKGVLVAAAPGFGADRRRPGACSSGLTGIGGASRSCSVTVARRLARFCATNRIGAFLPESSPRPQCRRHPLRIAVSELGLPAEPRRLAPGARSRGRFPRTRRLDSPPAPLPAPTTRLN